MGKAVHDDVLDGALSVVKQATRMVALANQPADYSAAEAGKLAETSLGAADFTISNGATSGRRVAVAEKSNVAITTGGTATHIALLDASRVLYVTTCSAQPLTQGGTVRFGTWEVELADPA